MRADLFTGIFWRWHIYALGLKFEFFPIKNRSQYQHELAEEFSDFKVAAEQHRQLSELGIHFQKDLSDDRVIWVQSFLKFSYIDRGVQLVLQIGLVDTVVAR